MGWKDAGGLGGLQGVCQDKRIQMVLEEHGLWLCSSQVLKLGAQGLKVPELGPLPLSHLSLHRLLSHSLKGRHKTEPLATFSVMFLQFFPLSIRTVQNPQVVFLFGSSVLHSFPGQIQHPARAHRMHQVPGIS